MPITLAEVKAHLRIDDTESDALLEVYIKAARTKIEAILGRSLLTQTRAAYFDGFRDTLELDYPPLQSVTSITFLNEQGVTETLDPSVYRVVTENTVGRVELAFGASWPATYPVTNAVVVTYVAGYGSGPADVPEHLRLAMLHMVARWYENREPVVVGASATELDGVEERLCYDRLIPI